MTDLTGLVAAANAPLADAGVTRQVGPGPNRYELYHFALSLCSQKVRTTLAEAGASYIGHDLNVGLPLLGNYDPAYVRLRLEGHPGGGFATGYTGRSAVGTEGFDPAVVPTLVDHDLRQVVTDSKRICLHIAGASAPHLVPADRHDAILSEMDVVDGMPQVALLYGAHPDRDFRPARLRDGMPGVHDRKIAKIRQARDSVAGDAALTAAYDAKIAKEEAARDFVGTADDMRAALRETLAAVAALDDRLADGRTWICGADFTLADAVWAVGLYRLKWLGAAFAWTGGDDLNPAPRPHVAAYVGRAFARPAFRAACIDWPGMPRTEFVEDDYA